MNVDEEDSLTECAVLTTFNCKERPLLNHLFRSKVPTTIFKNPKGKAKNSEPVQENKHARLIVPPNRIGFGCYHPKMMLLKFSDVLRVVVSSANLVEIDWYELGQVIWFQDFPKNEDSIPQTNDFLQVLTEFFDL